MEVCSRFEDNGDVKGIWGAFIENKSKMGEKWV